MTGNGPKGAEALAKKQSALHQITSLRAQIVSLAPLLDSMPSAVGADGPKTYLVAIMNPSEMRASGGAPLSVAFVNFDNGKMSLTKKGATSALTGMNAQEYWNRLTGKKDPFALPAGEADRFVNTNVNPDFATSGEQMRRATKANFGIKTDGVIALDLTAIGHLLDLTGPIKTGYYGTITGQNIADKLVVKAYQNASGNADTEVAARHDVNDRLMSVMLNRLTEGGGLVGKARALGLAVPGRHLELYFRDPALQKVVVAEGMGGTIPVRRTGNLTAVYTQNGNGNKMDVFQRRTVTERVKLRADGSALVRRTVALENPTPPYTAPFADRHRGYDTRWATNLVINLMPKGARVVSQPVVTHGGHRGQRRRPGRPDVREGGRHAAAGRQGEPDLVLRRAARGGRAGRPDVLPRLRRAAVDAAYADPRPSGGRAERLDRGRRGRLDGLGQGRVGDACRSTISRCSSCCSSAARTNPDRGSPAVRRPV